MTIDIPSPAKVQGYDFFQKENVMHYLKQIAVTMSDETVMTNSLYYFRDVGFCYVIEIPIEHSNPRCSSHVMEGVAEELVKAGWMNTTVEFDGSNPYCGWYRFKLPRDEASIDPAVAIHLKKKADIRYTLIETLENYI